MNTPVNFEMAKLLKEKGFDRPCCEFYYMENNPNKLEEAFNKNKKWDFNFENEYQFPFKSISAPIIAEVIMWLYEKYEIWINTSPIDDDMKLWQARIIKGSPVGKLDNTLKIISYDEILYNCIYSPTEAYESAIKYTLKKLV